MGVDSGLPDFRGDEGFWRAYPPFRALGLSFAELADPRWFRDDPSLAWGFYGHRAALYRDTIPHAGFTLLAELCAQKSSSFVFTSNVDGQFFRAGFRETEVLECHGSIAHVQCSRPCDATLWTLDPDEVAVDLAAMRAVAPFPTCPRCGAIARPNILMFRDGAWVDARAAAQQERFTQFLEAADLTRTVVIEAGAGLAVPTVRSLGEQLRRAGARLVRINVREAQGPAGTLSLPFGALEALSRLATGWSGG